MAASDNQAPRRTWLFSARKSARHESPSATEKKRHPRWNMGMLNDKETIEVPGSVLLIAKDRNEPLGLRNAPARTSHSSLPTGLPYEEQQQRSRPATTPKDEKKKTEDGQIILEPQPDDSHNDPLNWPAWRRDSALLSLGLYCMVGGGITPIIAAGFTDVAEDYGIDVEEVAFTTGLYMMGLGIGCVVFSPTAILYGKRPVYLFSAVLFVLSAVWCALSPNFTSLILARIFQGIAVSPVECLPSATIAEIFFLHERAYRIGVYTLLLLGGKNLVPLVSAVIIEGLSWRWVFWIVAMIVVFCGALLFFFVPETFWDRTPVPRSRRQPKRPGIFTRRSASRQSVPRLAHAAKEPTPADTTRVSHPTDEKSAQDFEEGAAQSPASPIRHKSVHVGFAPDVRSDSDAEAGRTGDSLLLLKTGLNGGEKTIPAQSPEDETNQSAEARPPSVQSGSRADRHVAPSNPVSRRGSMTLEKPSAQPSEMHNSDLGQTLRDHSRDPEAGLPRHAHDMLSDTESEKMSTSNMAGTTKGQLYTHALRQAPPKSFSQQLKIYHGRLSQDKWWKVAVRPLILYSYPAVLWSSAIYACSVGWLIVISESVALIYREGTYHFNALQTGLVYISPFVGGVLGTAVAGKVSDVIVKAMARRNGGLYEPEFRLVMAAPIAITTVIGLMGFGWSADVGNPWIVPTVFFGVVSFGCSLGSTTSITFCVDSYRQYAGEALVTLNFSKNVIHGLVFSLFVTEWLAHDGPKTVYIWIGIMQLIILLFTIPMYIYGKRARMWTVRKNFMEKW
ncbi:hypothetical protein DL769_011017 [Monosporascus sp. CRB-8-3]|nr:hypothetical protein DL769_011017 [Monosporascus sp. CRB-8-3]